MFTSCLGERQIETNVSTFEIWVHRRSPNADIREANDKQIQMYQLSKIWVHCHSSNADIIGSHENVEFRPGRYLALQQGNL